ncbi:MAG: polyprenyl synthetase family protein [Succinivibrionaceae bacterium]|nr:polyprenyl synthetase family protein [Succinivibrionaceae bacterium]
MSRIALIDELKPLMEEFEQLLVSYEPSEFSEVNEVMRHILTSGGKRLRPILLLTMGKIIGYTGDHLPLACAVEMIHTATLLHDDVIDKSELRRGKPTANATYGVPASILFGDYLYTKAFRLLLKYGNDRISSSLLDVVRLMSEGEIKQMFRSHAPDTDEKTYFEVIAAKTSCLFMLSCEMAALLTQSADHPYARACHDFGMHFGNAFQITDDVMDYTSDSAAMGKTPGDDFAEGKLTLPLIHLLGCAAPEERQRILALLENREADAEATRRRHFDGIKEQMKRYGSFEYCQSRAGEEIAAAKAALEVFADSPCRRFLVTLTEGLANRSA